MKCRREACFLASRRKSKAMIIQSVDGHIINRSFPERFAETPILHPTQKGANEIAFH